jgi:putative ATP-dependent endonuclease of the OLD family
MHISKVAVRNYRNFMNSTFEFNKGINTIIGENGSGKTNLFRAIRLILDDNLYRFAYKLDEGDFNRNIGRFNGHWIIISVEFSELSDDESIQALFIHSAGNIEGNSVEKATYNLFFRPKAEIRKKLSELSEGDKEGLEKILESIKISDYETRFTGKSTADFCDDDVYRELVGDFEKVKFNFDIDEEKFGIGIPNQLSVSKEISFTFIQALRDVISEFHNNKTNPLLALLKAQSERIDDDSFNPISEQVKKLNESIEGLKDVQQIRTDIGETIKETVGQTYSPSSLSIKSNLSEEADKLLQSLRLFIGEPNEDHEGSIHELSLGGANLIFLTLKLLEYKYRKSEDTFANFLFIEEPEAHIHTHIQKTLFDKVNFDETQIIYSTHSTHISEVSKISNMNILAKKRNHAEVYQPAKNLDSKWVVKLERYLDAIRSNLLFAKGVILVEGDAEEILIPILVRKVYGVSLDELGISLINIRSTGFENIATIFHNDRIRRNCSIITDLDSAIDDDGKGAEEKGKARKTRINEFCKKNDWVEAFYAEHTFEIDFISSGNSHEAKKTIKEVYTDPATIKKSKEDLDSDDVKVYGKRILTMANNEGKGWFAILLGKFIEPNTYIPSYILDALVFAVQNIEEHLLNIMIYRVEYLKANNEDGIDFTNIDSLIDLCKSELEDIETLKKELTTTFPKDDITDLLKRV